MEQGQRENPDQGKWREMERFLKQLPTLEGMTIPILQKVQELYGFLPKEILRRVAKKTGTPGSQLYGVATFYAQFRFTPIGRNMIKVCHGTACHVSGAEMISDAIMTHLKIKEDETTADLKYTFTKVACLGCCSLAPVMMINNDTFGRLNPDKVKKILDEYSD